MRVGLIGINQTVLNGYPQDLIPPGETDLVVGGAMVGLTGATVDCPPGTTRMQMGGAMVAYTLIRVKAPVSRTITVCRDRRQIIVSREVCE